MPGRIMLKNQPKLHLTDVLRRRRSTLTMLIGQLGISTYAALERWCAMMGVCSPTELEFKTAYPSAGRVNSPQEGVVVVEVVPQSREVEEASPVTTEDTSNATTSSNTKRTRRSLKE